jgi:transcriptional regulator of arginine metabolism
LLRVSGQRNVQVATAEKPENGLSERFYRIFSESVLSMTHAYNQIVLKTLPGSANVAAEMIDGLRWPEILGTLAGDNTILMLVRSVEEVDTVLKRIDDMLR